MVFIKDMEHVTPMCILCDPGQVSHIAMPFSSGPYNNNSNSCVEFCQLKKSWGTDTRVAQLLQLQARLYRHFKVRLVTNFSYSGCARTTSNSQSYAILVKVFLRSQKRENANTTSASFEPLPGRWGTCSHDPLIFLDFIPCSGH